MRWNSVRKVWRDKKHYVLGLEVVTPTGEIIRTGGRTSKNVTGFDLTGLICGSEGMLGIITEATLKLLPLPQANGHGQSHFPFDARGLCVCRSIFQSSINAGGNRVLDRNRSALLKATMRSDLRLTRCLVIVSVDGSAEEVSRTLVVGRRRTPRWWRIRPSPCCYS